MGYVDILSIPTPLVEDHIIPTLSPKERRELVIVPPKGETAEKALATEAGSLETDMVEFLLEHRATNGTSTMLIDLDRCTRCDDCVRACASTHDNNPRFIRHGPVIDNIQITNACMHCIDPVCMLECPTGAIHREVGSGHILINDYTCIGCAMCANSCPYDNIQMVPIRDIKGLPQYPVQIDDEGNIVAVKNSEEPFRKATKCDLCADYIGGPACVRACPHDALKRADMQDVPTLVRWLKR
jgi:Fe-S-cluster-containing dehydrogenase component